MDLTKSCWDPPIVSFELLLGIAVGAALLLVGAWRRFGTAAVLAPWCVLVVGCGWVLAIRMTHLAWTPPVETFAWELAPLAAGGLLATLASAALWSAAPRAPATVHAAATVVQFVLAYVLGFTAMELVSTLAFDRW